MTGEHSSNIFCLGFDNENTKLFSAGNDEQVIVHDATTGATIDVFLHEEAVYGLSIDPLNSNIFASACDDGRVLIWDIREPSSSDPFCLASCSSAFHAVMYNPVESRLLACANSREGMSLWDIRNPKSPLLKYIDDSSIQSCMSVRFNSSGTQILALRRRLPPALYDISLPSYIYQFDHPGYYNICTMKSCCFAGEQDQYVLSGSDDFNLYVWKIPKEGTENKTVENTHMILKGHRSIVNQVRFNNHNFLLASSGVEKIIKLWSPFQLPHSSGGLRKGCTSNDKERKIYTHEEYINLVMRSGQVVTHDYSHQSTKEDPRMMAFFDSLVQREIEGMNTDSNQSAVNSDSWLFNVVESFSLSEIDSSSNVSSDSETAVSGDRVSDESGAAALSSLSDIGTDTYETGFPVEDINGSTLWQPNSDRSNFSTSSITSTSSSSSSSSEEVRNDDDDENGVCGSDKLRSWSSKSSISSSIESLLSSESEIGSNSGNRKRLSYWERRKLLRKRRMQLCEESDDSDFNSEDRDLSATQSKKRACLKFRNFQVNGKDKNGSSSSSSLVSLANTSSEIITPNESCSGKNASEDPNKCNVVCVAAQNSNLSPLTNGEDEEAATPDSGITSRSFDNEKPSPSTSTCDSPELDPSRSNKETFKIRNIRANRKRVYRKSSPQDCE
ncbi:hypothetical protein CHUAL_009989 [Chamberlinius hualienensis]